jgi:hypothetical protein
MTRFGDRALRDTFVFGTGFNRHSYFFGVLESPADISIFRTCIECNQPIAVLAVRLEPVADFLRALSGYLRAFRASYFYFFVDHEMLLTEWQHPAFLSLRACLRVLLNP